MLFTVSGIVTCRPALSVMSLVPSAFGVFDPEVWLSFGTEDGELESPQAANDKIISAASKDIKYFFIFIFLSFFIRFLTYPKNISLKQKK